MLNRINSVHTHKDLSMLQSQGELSAIHQTPVTSLISENSANIGQTYEAYTFM